MVGQRGASWVYGSLCFLAAECAAGPETALCQPLWGRSGRMTDKCDQTTNASTHTHTNTHTTQKIRTNPNNVGIMVTLYLYSFQMHMYCVMFVYACCTCKCTISLGGKGSKFQYSRSLPSVLSGAGETSWTWAISGRGRRECVEKTAPKDRQQMKLTTMIHVHIVQHCE